MLGATSPIDLLGTRAGSKPSKALPDVSEWRTLAEPFGHGRCILQMNERGYDALLERPERLDEQGQAHSGEDVKPAL